MMYGTDRSIGQFGNFFESQITPNLGDHDFPTRLRKRFEELRQLHSVERRRLVGQGFKPIFKRRRSEPSALTPAVNRGVSYHSVQPRLGIVGRRSRC